MSEYIAETIAHKGLTIKIIADPDAQNPRREKYRDNFGTMACWHSRYDLGDEIRGKEDDPHEFLISLAEEFREGLGEWVGNGLWRRIVTADFATQPTLYREQKQKHSEAQKQLIWDLIHKHYIILPLRLYDHSGITMSIGSGAHPQDPGGWDSGQVGWIYCTKKKAVEEFGKKVCTRGVIAKTEALLTAEVEEYDQYLTGDVWGYVIEDEDGETLDSLWGMYGIDYCRAEAIEEADNQLVRLARLAAESAGDVPMTRASA